MIEIPVPRYFKEDDRIEHDIKFKEAVERDAKKKKKKAKKKKKKKKGGDDEEPKEPKIFLDEKVQLMDNLLDKYKGTKGPEIEITQDPFQLEINIHFGIRLIQKNERGRQGIDRISKIFKTIENALIQKEIERKAKEGKIQKESEENKENNASVFIQKRIRGILARKYVDRVRQEEMEFLGMQRK